MASKIRKTSTTTPDAPSAATEVSGFYIPSLDGLRAVAFSFVFVSHVGLQIVPGGFGVTIFFFLSGYLICSLLRREAELTGSIDLQRFYLRRALRIGPPLYISLSVMIAMSLAGALPGDLKFWPVASEAAFITNYYTLYGSDPTAIPAGSGVLWSLAVEEHFYLLFPLALSFMLKKSDNSRTQAILVLGACGLVLAWRVFLVLGMHSMEDRTYYGTDTRLDSLLFGCILALFTNPAMEPKLALGHRTKVALYLGAGCLLLFSFVWRDQTFRATLRYTLQGFALLPIFYLAIVDHQKPWFAWLNWKPIKAFGVMTYTIYLVHLSVIASTRWLFPTLSTVPTAVLAFAVSMLFAWGMYVFIEAPLAGWRVQLRRVAAISSKTAASLADGAASGATQRLVTPRLLN